MTWVYVFSVISTFAWPISSAVTLLGTPSSCDQEEYVYRNVSHVAWRKFSDLHAGATQRRITLFGEMGLPVRVQKTRSSGFVRVATVRQSWRSSRAAGERGWSGWLS